MAGTSELRLRTIPERIRPRRNRLLAESPFWAMASVYCGRRGRFFTGPKPSAKAAPASRSGAVLL
jgi:hypothetical protein